MRKGIPFWVIGLGFVLWSCISYSATTTTMAPAYDMSVADTHWAFIPLVKPEIPATMDSAYGNEVDAFILEQLQERGLKQNGRVDKRSLIRRVTFDLTGLPPSYEEVQSFLTDDSPDAYEQLVERLLGSNAYGERWARHWLDVARYADTQGIFRGGRYAYSHTYRDYVIEAFNEDKPYDQFILEQIAADQLDLGEDKSALAAMGFLTLGRTFFGRKDFIIDDQIDVITRGLQGLTVTCARCHDHKFDPIPTSDYYSLHGVFASSENPEELPVIQPPENEDDYASYLEEIARIEKNMEVKSNEVIDTYLLEERSLAGNYLTAVEEGKTIIDKEDFKVFAGSRRVRPELLRLWIDYMEKDEALTHPVLRAWFENYAENDPEAGAEHYNHVFTEAVKKEAEGYADVRCFLEEPGTPLNPDREAVADWIGRKIRGEIADLSRELEALEWTHAGAPVRAHILADVSKPKNSSVYMRGDPKNLGDEVPRQFLEILSGGNRKPFSMGSGRLELARKIASADNPLTARVFVNRVWGWHMGKEIVDTPSDFGVRTPEPVQMDLLNWLAASFVESGWSIKSLHRLIVLSNTYKQSSAPSADGLRVDPVNQLWHYFPRSRLDFESMRDTLLAVSGKLDRTMGGLQVDITDPTTNRRTVYSYIDRQDMPGVFRTFDHPSPEATSPARFETVIPQQALFLMNSPFVIEQAKHLADRSKNQAGSNTEERIRYMYRVLFQREASTRELKDGSEFLEQIGDVPHQGNEIEKDEEKDEDAMKPLNGWQLYSQVLLLSNELIFID